MNFNWKAFTMAFVVTSVIIAFDTKFVNVNFLFLVCPLIGGLIAGYLARSCIEGGIVFELLEEIRKNVESHEYDELKAFYKVNYLFTNYIDDIPNLDEIGELFEENDNEYCSTAELPYELIKIEANPEYPNISKCECIIVFMLSKSEIRFFYYFNEDVNWDEIKIDEEEMKWISEAIKFKEKEDIINFISNVQNSFADFVIEKLDDKNS